MTSNSTLKAWKPDEDLGGTVDAEGHYVPGESPVFYVQDHPCTTHGFTRSEVRDATNGSILMEPGRISLDWPRTDFTLGDYVSVVYNDGQVVDRVGEIRRIAWVTRGTRQTIIWVEWLKGHA